MTSRPPLLRLGVAAFLAAALVVALALPAAAVGAGGVEMTIHLQRTGDDRLLLEVGDEPVSTMVTLTNRTTDPKSVEVYAVEAQVQGSDVALGRPESGAWIGFDRAGFDLGPEEIHTFEFTTERTALPQDGEDVRHAAVVMEISQGASVVLRAASVVRVQGSHALPPFMMVLVALATVLLVATGYWLTREVSRRRRARSTTEATAAA